MTLVSTATDSTLSQQQYSRLLALPAELQLSIYELVLFEDEPLLLNCGCDSSYNNGRDDDQWQQDKEAWKAGEKHPPMQPGLTRTCHGIRNITLPLFYKHNTFRAHYCHSANFDTAFEWLRKMGEINRQHLRQLFLHDDNPGYDSWELTPLKTVSRMLVDLGARTETLSSEDYCCHRVSFPEPDDDYHALRRMFDD